MAIEVEESSNKTADITSIDIVEGIENGNKHYESLLVKRYSRGLLFVLNRKAQNTELAADIAQDTFITVIEKIRAKQLEKPDALSAFIRQIGVNILIAHFRKETRRNTALDPDIDAKIPIDEIESLKTLHDQKLLNLVVKFIREMDVERDREMLRNYFFYEKSKAQICIDLNIDKVHFDRVLHRSRTRLKKALFAQFPEMESVSAPKIAALLSLALCMCLYHSTLQNSQAHQKKTSNQMGDFELQTHYKNMNDNISAHIFGHALLPHKVSKRAKSLLLITERVNFGQVAQYLGGACETVFTK